MAARGARPENPAAASRWDRRALAVETYRHHRLGLSFGEATEITDGPPALQALADTERAIALLPNNPDTANEWRRGSTLVEKNKEYVQAARVIGVSPLAIMGRHVLPNVLGPVLVLATVHIATAIITEATLSFLGVGVPPTTPSLGTLIRIGNEFLFSGEWWITIFPGAALVLLVLSVNLLGDWLRDALNPKLR